MDQWPGHVLFGAAYYYEYQPYERLKTDLDLMAEASFSVIRVGESVWSTWEPENGRFELDWLQPVLDGAHERGIGVVLGTPTYAVPPWLARQYPEIAGERSTGQRIPWGARQEVDFTHPAFRFHAERVIRRIVARYADHPAILGYQVDNEPGNELFHNRGVFERFVDDLRHQYGDVETLNREWGLVYWSHRLSTWNDLWVPDGNAQPQYDLAWRRFQARQTTEFIDWQADIAREYARPGQFVTTCLSYGRPALDDHKLTAWLDITAGNPYYTMQDGLEITAGEPDPQGWTTNGTWALYLSADRMYSSRQEPFLVTETNAQAIGGPSTNKPAYDGQWRQAAWALVSRGARMIEYWHWHTLHFGTETYWGGILPHSGRPGRTYRELARLGAELRTAGDLIGRLTPDADVTMLYSAPSKWALQAQPALSGADGGPDRQSYQSIFDPFYRGAFDAGLQVNIVHAGQFQDDDAAAFAQRHPVLVVPGLYIADDATLDRLVAYAGAGGHLVLGPRTGYGDHEARARREVQPARLADAAGVWYDEFTTLTEDVTVRTSPGSALALPDDALATRWSDGLQTEDSEILAQYEHPHFGQFAAATTRTYGKGRITYVGTVPNTAFAEAIFRWIDHDHADGWQQCQRPLTVTSAHTDDGRTVRFVHNWSWDEASLRLPSAVRDVLSGTDHAHGDELRLGAWDVRVLLERG
ncbi:beta-galactosidase [Phytoactinopolyspora endophytica]|uniref:beta-galactosidase n=1 Tax=Phytoactinopolyspora endophytica TaxID=1642495 RepID=UPI00101BE6A7|nr:beta-galactosidase [Phytoactinopolyspora endophytica]